MKTEPSWDDFAADANDRAVDWAAMPRRQAAAILAAVTGVLRNANGYYGIASDAPLLRELESVTIERCGQNTSVVIRTRSIKNPTNPFAMRFCHVFVGPRGGIKKHGRDSRGREVVKTGAYALGEDSY